MHLSLIEQQHKDDVMPIDPNDDFIFDSKMNDSKDQTNGDHEMILHNEDVSSRNI